MERGGGAGRGRSEFGEDLRRRHSVGSLGTVQVPGQDRQDWPGIVGDAPQGLRRGDFNVRLAVIEQLTHRGQRLGRARPDLA
jgi:hypothetical protein